MLDTSIIIHQMNLSISLAQMQVVTGDFQKNTSRGFDLIQDAIGSKSDIILFPEMWTAGFDYSNCHEYSLSNRALLGQLQQFSDEKQISIGGSYLLESENHFYNEFVLIQPKSASHSYRKIHLFHLMEEDTYLTPGEKVSVIQTRWGSTNLSVCYDLRFPEMFRLSREKGVTLVLMVAGWPLKRIDHWKILLRARAIENQLFFAAVNCVGGDNKVPFGGASAIIDPWGETILEASSDSERLITGKIDLEEVVKIRNNYPFFQNRRSNYTI